MPMLRMPRRRKHAVVDDVERAPERPAFGAVAGDHQHRFDVGFAVEPRQECVERFDAYEVARRHMRHRLRGRRRVFATAAASDLSAGRFGTALR